MASSYFSSSGGGGGGDSGSGAGGAGGGSSSHEAMGGWMPSASEVLRAAKFRGILRPLAADAIDAIQRQLLRELDRGVALDLILQDLAEYLGRHESGPGGGGGGAGAITEAVISDVVATMTRDKDDMRAVRTAGEGV